LEPLKQTLLAILADIDLAHNLKLEATRKSAADEALKAKLINALLRRHREKREPYMQELMNLEHRMQRVLRRA